MPSDSLDELNKAILFFDAVRYNEANIIFSTTPHDNLAKELKDSKVVFLEKGNDNAGLVHILLRHLDDFKSRDFDSDGIVKLLNHTLSTLRPLVLVKEKRGIGLEYAFDDRLYPKLKHDTLKVAIGYNGFIVSAFVVGLASVMGRLRGIADSSGKE